MTEVDSVLLLLRHICTQPLASRCGPSHCKRQPEEGKDEEGDVHMRALSLCNLELYVRDTVFQASIYRSIHMAIHFCEDKSSDVNTMKSNPEIVHQIRIFYKGCN